jgi:hypothetical protein
VFLFKTFINPYQMKHISIVVNKNWEVEPVLNAMASSTIRATNFPFPNWLNSPKDGSNRMSSPRSIYQLNGPTPLQVTIWCLQDLMNPLKSSSSSEEKFRVLPYVLAAENPDMVFAVGTAAYPDAVNSNNGKVIIGSQFFMHNGHPDNPDSNFKTDQFDKLLTSNVTSDFFSLLSPTWCGSAVKNFLPVPNMPSVPEILVNQNYVSVGDLNITDYTEYATTDPLTLTAFQDLESGFITPSLETTHGIIRLSSNAPTIFISAIVNRIKMVNQEATPAQNYAGAFNAGVTISNLLGTILQSSDTGIWN